MNTRALKLLEYDQILGIVSDYAVSDRAKSDILQTTPFFDLAQADRLQQITEQAIIMRDKYLVRPVFDLDDIVPLLDKADVGITLTPSDFLKIAKLLQSVKSAQRSASDCGDDVSLIKEYLSFIPPDSALLKHIEETVAGENEIRDGASDALRTIRRKIAALNNKLKEKLYSYTHDGDIGKYLQDNIVTLREDRFVIPVKSECRSAIPGLIHDRSASGSTIYVEPFPVVEMNNDLKALKAAERSEIERILRSLTADTVNEKNAIKTAYEQLTELDVIFAKAAFSDAYKCTRPLFNKAGSIDLINCRHPLIDKERVIPITVEIGKDFNFLIITGANTGGKTVSLKTVGLFCLMAYSGIRLPCDEGSTLPVFDNIYCDIGDEQSISQSLSTFSSHIRNIAEIADSVTPDSLVLLDEIGVGTDPIEGAALAIGILKYFELINCKGIITTHYSELKEYALISDKLTNACMQFDEQTLTPTYRLIMGLPGVSNAIDIASKLGINDYILKNARACLTEEKIRFEKVLLNAEQVKSKALKELEEIERLKNQLSEKQRREDEILASLNARLARINNNAKIETQKIIRKATEKAEELIEEIKEKLAQADEQALLEAKRLQKQLESLRYDTENEQAERNYIPITEEQIFVGAKVIIRSLNLPAQITSLADRKGLFGVASGSMHLKLPLSDLAQAPSLRRHSSRKTEAKTANDFVDESNEPTIEEIRVLGMTVSEAIEVLEQKILQAQTIMPRPILKIVHGKGTGALGKGIQNFCRNCPSVRSYRYGRYGEGESGVTFVEIK